jgi:hypothetical protein
MKAAVFTGPSLDHAAAARVLDAHYLPPIERGDIDALMASPEPPTHVGIVDGQFLHRPSISPKEILVAMDAGVRLFGASSMGALRAVELSPYGMLGVGKIYGLFQSGQIDDDDEVAITFDPETLEVLCEPMVNIRIAAAAAVDEGAVSRAGADAFMAAAKSLYFPQRSYRAALHLANGALDPAERDSLERFLATRAPDAKRVDALAMLAAMREDMDRAAGS